ncbi:MAG: LuxR family transcriptional regulator [Micromonosporaceae bacterium]
MNVPRYLLQTTADATTVLRRLARSGWKTREGFALPDPAWDVSDKQLLLFGRVPDLETAALAVLAAARGAGVVAIADADAEPGRSLLADLARIGPVGRDADEAPGESTEDDLPLTEEQRALLARLAAGETIAAAATSEFLSLRTANRRIAQARAALGVRTTREAVLAYLRQSRDDE